MRRLLLATAAAALVLPGAALADATIVSRDVPLHGERALAASAPARFTLVGLHWQGSGRVEFRTRSTNGRWTEWFPAAPEDEDVPDRGSPENRRGAWRLGNPYWVGASNGIRYRLHGDVRKLRAWFVWSPEVRIPMRRLSIAGSPPIVRRSGWRADESIVRAKPSVVDRLEFAVVHHTAGRNVYSSAESAAIVRGIELFHVKGNGWNDIGYNFLVDKYGTVFEGRGGGIDRNVVGAHAEGFNTGSVGVALIGDYSGTAVPKPAEDALARLLAWRLDIAHIDPLSSLTHASGGNPRFGSGLPVFLRAISGHRDTGFTSCPGGTLYGRLPTIANAVARLGLPKLYDPKVTGTIGGLVRFRGRLSGALPWRIGVTDANGLEVASFAGLGPAIDWSWDATAVQKGAYRWRIDAGTSVLGASGTIGVAGVPAGPLAITNVTAQPETVSPNGDGQADQTTLTYTLSQPALVSISLLDSVGSDLGYLVKPVRRQAGTHTATFTGAAVADGTYQLFLKARGDDGTELTAVTSVLVSRTLGQFAVAPAAFSPNGDGRKDRLSVSYTLSSPALVRVRVLRDGKYVTTLTNAQLAPGTQRLDWDGTKRVGRLLDGDYEAIVEATDTLGVSTLTLPFLSDTHAPVVRILRGKPLRVWLSEPSLLTMRINGFPLTQDVQRAGNVRVAWGGPASAVRVVAWDAAGNVSKPATRR